MIKLENINKTYFNGAALHVLKGLNLHIHSGEFVSIMGASGSGKSTLLNIVGILDDYDTGTYYLNGKLIRDLTEKESAVYRNQTIGFVFQSFNLISFKRLWRTLPFLCIIRAFVAKNGTQSPESIWNVWDWPAGKIIFRLNCREDRNSGLPWQEHW